MDIKIITYIDLAKPKSGAADCNKLTWIETAIQWKASTLAAVNSKIEPVL